MNPTQIENLRKLIAGEPVDTCDSRAYASMYTARCDVCGKSQIYPLFVGVGPEVQVWKEPEKYAVVCTPCISELTREHFRRTTYDNLFKTTHEQTPTLA